MTRRPDPRRPWSWCGQGVAHDHGACGDKWNTSDPRDIAEANQLADDLDSRTSREITPATVAIRLVKTESGFWAFGVTFPGREEFLMPWHATAALIGEAVAAARARQIRDERAPHAPVAVVGDVLGVNDPIPDNVTEVGTADGLWRRAVGDERYVADDDGTVDRSTEYDWVTVAGGGWTVTDGLYDYAPITVTRTS